MTINEWIASIFLFIGFVFLTFSAFGILRLNTFLTRLHPSGVGETIGMIFMGIGFIILQGLNFTSLKIAFIVISMFIVNPVATHLISKSAHKTTSFKDLMATDKVRIQKIKLEEKIETLKLQNKELKPKNKFEE